MKVTFKYWQIAMASALLAAAPSLWAAGDIPTTSGFSGKVSLLGAYTDAETNFVKGSELWEIGTDRIDSAFSPADGESDQFIAPGLELQYTFGGPQIQLFLESDIEELVTLETLQQAGIRKQFDSLGILSLGYVTSGLLAQEVYQDPYDATQSRNDTDREFTGARFKWSKIFNTPIGFMVQYQDVEVDDERSGQALGLTAAQQSSLNREGDVYRGEVDYTWQKSNQELFRMYVGYTEDDLDGDAVSNDGFYIGVDAGYQNQTWGAAGRIKAGNRDYDERNPVYGRVTDTDYYEIVLDLNYRLPWGNNWFAKGGVAWGENNSKIDFHDEQNLLFTAGAEWRFGQ